VQNPMIRSLTERERKMRLLRKGSRPLSKLPAIFFDEGPNIFEIRAVVHNKEFVVAAFASFQESLQRLPVAINANDETNLWHLGSNQRDRYQSNAQGRLCPTWGG